MYIQKQKETADRTNAFCEFLVTMVNAIYGGKSDNPDEVNLDTGEGMDEMSDEDIAKWKEILGESDFAKQYPDYV